MREPRVLRRHPRGALPGVTLLGLDAPDGEHRLPGDVDHVDTEREGDHRVVRQPELAGADERHVLVQAAAGELAVDPGEPQPERQRDGVGEDQGRGAGPALAAVDGHEVDPASLARHHVGEVAPEPQVAHRRLDAHRQPGLRGEQLHEVQHRVDVVELRVPRRAQAVHAHAARRGSRRSPGRPSRAGSTPPRPGFAPWLSLISSARIGVLSTSSLSRGRLNRPSSSRQPKYAVPIWKTRSRAVAVVRRDRTLAGVVQAAGVRGAPVDGLDGVARTASRSSSRRRSPPTRAGRRDGARAVRPGPSRTAAGPPGPTAPWVG